MYKGERAYFDQFIIFLQCFLELSAEIFLSGIGLTFLLYKGFLTPLQETIFENVKTLRQNEKFLMVFILTQSFTIQLPGLYKSHSPTTGASPNAKSG